MKIKSIVERRFKDFEEYARAMHVSVYYVIFDYCMAKLLHGFTVMDYLEIGDGVRMSRYERKRFLTYKRMLKIFSKVNSVDYAHKLENKAEALKLFSKYVKRSWIYPREVSFNDYVTFVNNLGSKAMRIGGGISLIIKPLGGMEGKGIFKRTYSKPTVDELKNDYDNFVRNNYIVEECIRVHPLLDLKNKSLNTFRIFTMLDKNGKVQVIKAKFRAGIGDSVVDATDGSMAYPVNIKYGIIEGHGINNVRSTEFNYCHPDSNICLVGMKMPYWDEVLNMVREAALEIPQIRLIGWDVAVTENGPEIIEANHNPYHGTFEAMGDERLWYHKIKEMI